MIAFTSCGETKDNYKTAIDLGYKRQYQKALDILNKIPDYKNSDEYMDVHELV